MRRWTAGPVAAALAATLLGGACAGSDPADELATAVETTFDGAFRYAVTAEADGEALARLGERAALAGGLLAGIDVDGRVDGRGGVTLSVSLLGQEPVLEVRRTGPDAVYGRLELDLVLAALGADVAGLRERLAAVAGALDLPPAVEPAVLTAFDGDWVGVEGRLDADALAGAAGAAAATEGPSAAGALAAALGEDPGDFVDRFVTVTDVEEPDGDRRFGVTLRLRALLRSIAAVADGAAGGRGSEAALDGALDAFPAEVPGEVAVADGRVSSIAFDVGRAADTGEAGSLLVTLDISDVDDVPRVEPPDEAVVVPARDFLAGARRLEDALGRARERTG